MLKKAVVREVKIDSRNSAYVLRSGTKGTGKELGRVNLWPWSGPSQDMAYRVMNEIIEREDVLATWDTADEDW